MSFAPTCLAVGVVIDTDAGTDDLMAIAFLLARKDVRIEAITVANGLAHVEAGVENILRVLELAGRRDIPVYKGRETPLRGSAEFPAEWRRTSDRLPGVELPAARRRPEPEPAAKFLAGRRARILALGPLTNLAEAMPQADEILIMGGAVRARGNLGDGGFFKTDNTTAEWNLFVDPYAAALVFRSGVPIRMVPLDATTRVSIDLKFLEEFRAAARTPLGRLVGQILEAEREQILRGIFYAWDPLAAVALVEPAVVSSRPMHIEIRQEGREAGRTAAIPGRPPNAHVGLGADARRFRKLFLAAFQR